MKKPKAKSIFSLSKVASTILATLVISTPTLVQATLEVDTGGGLIGDNMGEDRIKTFVKRTGESNPFNSVSVDRFSIPAFTDIDGDKDLELIVSEWNGTLNYFRNYSDIYIDKTNSGFDPFKDNYDRVPSVTFADVTGDNKKDLIVSNGSIKVFKATNSGFSDVAETQNTALSNIYTGDTSGYSLAFADIDYDGDLDLAIGSQKGTIEFYLNTDGRYTKQVGSAHPFKNVDVGMYSMPTLGDVDKDGDIDLVVGSAFNGCAYFENVDGTFINRTGSENPFKHIKSSNIKHSSPVLVDINRDGDLDLVLGDGEGNIHYYEQYATTEVGNNSNNTFIGSHGDQNFDGKGGSDTVSYRFATSKIYARLWDDSASDNGFSSGFDNLYSIENLYGSRFDDFMSGNAEDNYLFGWYGNDTLIGGEGNDKLKGSVGADNLDGSGGNDTADFGGSPKRIVVKLWDSAAYEDGYGYRDTLKNIENITGTNHNDFISGSAENNKLWGAKGNDKVYGNNGNDKLYGGDGNDTIFGGNGNDMLYGGNGNDLLRGAHGSDVIFGGKGADIFQLNSTQGVDEIKDFNVSQGDKIRIDASVFSINSLEEIRFSKIYFNGQTQRELYINGQFVAKLNTDINVERDIVLY